MNPNVVEVKKEDLSKKKRPRCNFCDRSQIDSLMFGSMYQLDGITVHYFCMLFSSALSQNGEDSEGILGFLPVDIRKEVNRGKKLKCKFCKKPHATVGCSVKKCKCSFHYTCGLENGHSFEFIDQYCAYCTIHKRKSEIKIPRENWECPICFEKDFGQDGSPLKPPCCDKNNAVFHRRCMMQTAQTNGLHAFKCPLCNNKEDFSNCMRKQGIFVPDRDAAWELETGAYSELNQQYNRCDIVPCQCPQGRDYCSPEDGQREWKIIRCGGCGGAGVHIECGKLENFTYRCQPCKSILADVAYESEDEDELSQQGPRGLNTSRQGRINRSQCDSDSDDEEQPVHDIHSILDRIPRILESDEDTDSDTDNTTVISKASTDKTEIVVPLEKKERIFGKLFKVMGDSEDGSSELEDYDSEEEEDHGFAPIGNNISNEDNDENSSSSSEVRTGLVEVERNRDKVLDIVSSCRTPVRPSNKKLRSEAPFPDLNANMENIDDQETVDNMVESIMEGMHSILRQKEEGPIPSTATKQSPSRSNESIKSTKLTTPVKNNPQPTSSKYFSTNTNSVHSNVGTTQHEEDEDLEMPMIINEIPSSSSKKPANKNSSSNITNPPSGKKIPTLQSKLDKWLSPPEDDHEAFPTSTRNFSIVRDLTPELNREGPQNNSQRNCSPNILPPNIESEKNVPLVELSDDEDDDIQIEMVNIKTPPKSLPDWKELYKPPVLNYRNYVPNSTNPAPDFSFSIGLLLPQNLRHRKTGPDLRLHGTIILNDSDDEDEYNQNKLQQQNSGERVQLSKPNRDREPSNSKRLRSNAVDEENQSDETPTNKTPPKRPRVAKK